MDKPQFADKQRVTVYLPKEIITEIDAECSAVEAKMPGVIYSRSSCVEQLVLTSVEERRAQRAAAEQPVQGEGEAKAQAPAKKAKG